MRFAKLAWIVPFCLGGCLLETPDDNLANSADAAVGSRRDGGDPGEDPPVVPEDTLSVDAAIPDATLDAAIYTCTAGAINKVDPVSGSCYMYFPTLKTNDAAKAACAALGGGSKMHLVSLTSRTEQDSVNLMLNATDTWIGFSDSVVDGTFLWDSMEPTSFTYWAAGEPNGGIGSNCTAMKPTNLGLWYDRPCTNEHHYVCERDAP